MSTNSPAGNPIPSSNARRVQITSPSLQNGTTPDARTTPANDIPPNGFTAVNRESRVTMSFRPDGSARSTVTNMANDDDARQSGAETASAYSNYTPHGWRPDERSLEVLSPQSQPHHASGNMREQAEPPGVRSRDSPRSDDLYHTRMHSPKRRMVSGDPATYTSPDRGSHSGVHSSEALDRERPAAHEADRAKPPSPPLPETEGRLARSLQRSLEPPAQRDLPSHVEHQTRPSLGSAGPEELEMPDPRDGQQSTQYGADSQSSNEPKKRKRNFNNRTKTGCHTCRARKKKCDEGKPICGNCKRGAFECDGYGLKPPGGSKVGGLQPNVAAQAGQHFDQMNGVMPLYRGQSSSRGSTSWQPPKSEAYPPPPHHYGPPSPADYRYGPPPPVDHRTPHFGGSWDARPASGAQFNSSYLSERLQPTHHLSIAPPRTSPGQYQDFRPPSDSWISQNTQSHLPSGPPPNISSRESVQFSQSVKPGGFHLRMVPRSSSLSERTKMLTSQPFKCYTETEIQHDRKSCACAVEAYNNACAASSVTSAYEQARHFLSIIDPSKRIFLETLSHRWSRPSGTTGPRTIVISPFKCDFGYNLHLGEDTLIEAGCSMQDAALITIGDRVIVGPRASFCCITASVDASLRSGSQGRFVAGAIRVEDDVYIGANVTILPFRTIGKGAVVGAGSVVTRDVKPYTIVAGNPAKQIRKRKIESGPYVDRHDDAIQDENDKMQEWMRGYAQSKVPAGKVM